MATFTGQLISATYDAILKSIDNDPLGSVAKQITDGLGNVTPLYISTSQIGIGITPTEALHVSGNIIGTGTLAITGLTTFGTLKSNLATGATIGEFITEAQGIAANNNDTTLPTSAAVKDYVDSGNTGQVTGSGTGGKLPIWTGSGASSTLSDSSITEESTRFVLTKDIFINEGIPVLTLSDSNSSGSATLGDIIWQDSAATQRAIISLNNNTLGITSKQGGLTFGTASNPAMTIDTTQNAIFNSDLDVTGDFAVNTDKFTVNAVNGNTLVAGTLGVTSTLTSSDITTGNISAANGIFSGGITANGTSVTNTFKSTVLINRVGQQTSLLIGSGSIDDVVIGFQTDGNSMSMGIDRSDSNAFKISDSNGSLGTNDRFKIDTSGAAFFTGLVSGITPTSAANFVTKAYVDGLTPGAGVFLPLVGGTLTGGLIGTTATFAGTVSVLGNSDDSAEFLTIDDADDTVGSQRPQIKFTGEGSQLGKITVGDNGLGMLFSNSSNEITLRISDAGNSTFEGRVEIDGSPSVSGDTRAVLIIEEDQAASAGRGGGLAFSRQNNIYGGIKTVQNTDSNDNATMTFQTIGGGTLADRLTIDEAGNATFAGIVGMGSTGIYAGTGSQLNLPGRGLSIKNDLNGSSNNWSFIQNTATAGSANLNFHTGSNAAALTLSHLGNATFTGNVGIMTSNIDAPLTVQANGGGSAINIIGRNNGVADESIIGFYQNDGTTRMAYILADEQDLDFATGGSNVRMKITSGGDVAIAMSNYNSGPSASNYGLRLVTGATGKSYWQSAINAATAHFHYEFINTNGSVGKIQTSGSVTIYSTTSDYRLKEDLQDFAGLNMVSKIPVYDFKWKTDKSRSYGVMAHELKEVLPDAVSGNKDAEEMQSVDYSQIVPLLIKSIQELKAEVDLLKQECKCK